MKKLSIFLIATIFLTLIYQDISAQKNKGNMHRHEREETELNLTDVQKNKFKEIRFAHQESKIDLDSKLQRNRLEVKKLMSSENLNENELMNLVDNGNKIKGDLHKNRIKMWLELYNVLDDKQKEMWKDRFENLGERNSEFFRNHKRDFMRPDRKLGFKGKPGFEKPEEN